MIENEEKTDFTISGSKLNIFTNGLLFFLWFLVSYVLVFFCHDLNFMFLGYSFGYWIVAQGASLVFLAIIVARCLYDNNN